MNISEIKARCEAATPGEWESPYDSDTNAIVDANRNDVVSAGWCDQPILMVSENNAAFIAHSRTDLPVYVAEIERMQAENSNLCVIIKDQGNSILEKDTEIATLRRALEHACDAYIWR